MKISVDLINESTDVSALVHIIFSFLSFFLETAAARNERIYLDLKSPDYTDCATRQESGWGNVLNVMEDFPNE